MNESTNGGSPPNPFGNISVIVCSRDRPESLSLTVHSLLDSAAAFELFVIDQSVEPSASQRLIDKLADPRVRYVRDVFGGKGAALNRGLMLATGETIVCTDDDCVAPREWVRDMASVLASNPAAAIVFCNVMPAPHDEEFGYIPAFERRREATLSSVLAASNGFGLGAGMVFRRSRVLALGGFDEMFGPGSRFGSGDDWDIALRVLLRGGQIHETPSVAIRHDGFRTRAEGAGHALRDWIAIGAMCAKAVRAQPANGLPLACSLLVRKALWPPALDLLHFRRPSGFARIRGFARGFAEALPLALDRQTLKFR